MSHPFGVPWTAAEDAALREVYPSGIKAACEALPHRSQVAIYHRASRLFGASICRSWTDVDRDRLAFLWGADHSLEHIARQLGRTPDACYHYARDLGLIPGCPRGWEYLSVAGERTGYDITTLRRIMAWAGYPIHRSLSRGKAKNWRHVADSLEINDAVKRWNETETCNKAAMRRGVCQETLRRRLARLGIVRREGESELRVTDEQADRAMALKLAAPEPRQRAA